ncbi:MAG: 16S rRNA (cytidine(1402)-2'-O)-methyltransferase [Betaproteobacteria bacterium]
MATPIGNLGDLSPRAREVLRDADLLLAEDTRHTGQLLRACGVQRAQGSIESLHEHNERERVPGVIERLRAGATVALASDAGTPLMSDPGAALVSAAAAAGIEVIAVPGPCAAIAALTIAALPAARFAFEGFLPARQSARRDMLRGLATETRTLVFYEAPHRVRETLDDLAQAFGAERPAAVARELTKRFETVYRGTLGTLAQQAASDADMSRGEIVLVVQGAASETSVDDAEAERVLNILLDAVPVSQAARIAAQITGRARKELYERALRLRPQS